MNAAQPGRSSLTGFSRRAIGIGLLFVLLINVGVPYASFLMQSSRMTLAHRPIAVLIPFFFLLLVVNPVLRSLRPDQVLSQADLTLIFILMFVASLVPGKVLVAYLLGVIATPYYFARPENQWEATFFQYLPDWLLVNSRGSTLVWFYEGLPPGASGIPWGPGYHRCCGGPAS